MSPDSQAIVHAMAALAEFVADRHEIKRIILRAGEILTPHLQTPARGVITDAPAEKTIEVLPQSVGLIPIYIACAREVEMH